MSTLQRLIFSEIPTPVTGSGNNYRLRFHMDSLKASSNAHAYDFLTTWQAALAFNAELAPPPATPLYPTDLVTNVNKLCGPEIPATGGTPSLKDVCFTLKNNVGAATNTTYLNYADHPDLSGHDPGPLGDSVDPKLDAYQGRYNAMGDASALAVYTDQAIDKPILEFITYDPQGNSIWELRLHASTSSPVTKMMVLFGAHVAVGDDPFKAGSDDVGYGTGKGAASISGSPFHVSIDLFDNNCNAGTRTSCGGTKGSNDDISLGSQDNQLANDILIPPVPPGVTTTPQAGTTGILGQIVPVNTTVHDHAIVTGDANHLIPAGSTVTFQLFNNGTCSGTAINTYTGNAVSPTGQVSGSADSPDFTPTSPGSYSFLASFVSGDTSILLNKAGDPQTDCEPFSVGDAKIEITPANATNEIGTNHTLTIKVTASSGQFIGSSGTATATITSGPGDFVPPPASGGNVCTYTGGNGVSSASCTVVIKSTTPGTTVVSATSTIPIFGDGSVTRTTDGTGNNSGPANKTWVDANIQITPASDTDPISETHVLTLHVNVNPGTGFVNAPAGTTINVSLLAGSVGTLGATSCTTIGTTGSCTVNLTSTAVGTDTIHGSVDVTVGGVSLHRETDGVGLNSANATKTWVTSGVTTQVQNPANGDVTSAAVEKGTVVHDSATVDVGAGLTVPANSTFTFRRYTSLTCDPATLADTQTGVAVPSGARTGTASSASYTTTVAGRFGYIASFVSGDLTKAANATGACEPFSVVDANIQITPASDTDPISETHVLTLHVNVNDGTGFVNAPNGTVINVSLLAGSVGTLGATSCTTASGTGSCTVNLTSSVVGTDTIHGSVDVTVFNVPLHRETDGLGANSANATKTWVTSGVTTQVQNPANSDVTNGAVEKGTIVHDSATVDVGAGLTVPANSTFTFRRYTSLTCTPATLANTETGVAVPAGARTGTASSATFTPTAAGQFGYVADFVSGDLSKAANATGACEPFTVVDANINISPLADTNPIGTNHTLTVHVNINNGTGFANAPAGTQVTTSLQNSGGATAAYVGSSSCTTLGTTGECTVVINSPTAGTTTVHASTTVTVLGVTMTRQTGTTGNSNDASKSWVNANISITPATDTNPVGTLHTLTIAVNAINGTLGAGTATASIVSGPGSFVGSPTCSYAGGAANTCLVVITSQTQGTTVVSATSAIPVGTETITRTTNTAENTAAGGSGNAQKTWVTSSQITPTQTTCSVFSSGTSPTLSFLQYGVQNGKVNNVAEGVFFYWMRVDVASAGPQTFQITESITSSNNNFNHFFNIAAGSNVFTSACGAVGGVAITQNGDATVTTIGFNAASAGTYIIGIKYDSGSVKGFNVPSPNAIVDYQFTMGIQGSTAGIQLRPKP